ncbi:hypothetical protein Mrose_01107 [Calidithermus roseus]|uniref:Uncharacterized protein n=1 Tax=Calidithermus roseus TaxID=1644118 RepID=A0A399EXV1_9DEIN|nr:hypothetical protein Mrose_01107 [Calidithermus roseus]
MLALLTDFGTQVLIGLMLLVFMAVPFVLRLRRSQGESGQTNNDLPHELL